jgi:hypothetical protein
MEVTWLGSSSNSQTGSHGLEPVGDVLERTHRELQISRQKTRQIEGARLVCLKREEGKQTLAFSSRPFVLCGLPLRSPPAGQLMYERRNGQFALQVTGHPEFGLPFGQDRIVPIFLATLAVRQHSQTIRFRTASEMLETFGMHKGGKEYRRLVAAFERIFGATIFFGTDRLSGTSRVVQRGRFNFMREAQIWYDRNPDQRCLSPDFENTIVLSDEFYQEIIAHPIPTDLEAVKLLSSTPAVLDLFMWLSYRCYKAKGKESIPISGEHGLVNQLGVAEYSRPRRFRAMLHQWLAVIHTVWPQCPARITSDGKSLVLDHSVAILPRIVDQLTVNRRVVGSSST